MDTSDCKVLLWIKLSIGKRLMKREMVLFYKLDETMLAYPRDSNFPLCEFYFVRKNVLYAVQTSQEAGPREISIRTILSFLKKVSVPEGITVHYIYVPMPQKANEVTISVDLDVTTKSTKDRNENIRIVYNPKTVRDEENVIYVKNELLFSVCNIENIDALAQ